MKNTLLAFIVFISFGCDSNKHPVSVDISRLDNILRKDSVNLDTLKGELDRVKSALSNSTSRRFIPDEQWKTFITYKWDSDSSVVMIRVSKLIHGNQKRETILVYKDTAIVKLWNEQFFSEDRRNSNGDVGPGYIALEEINYLTRSEKVLILRRMDFECQGVTDTMKLKMKDFVNYTLTDEYPDFTSEMEYLKGMLNTN